MRFVPLAALLLLPACAEEICRTYATAWTRDDEIVTSELDLDEAALTTVWDDGTTWTERIEYPDAVTFVEEGAAIGLMKASSLYAEDGVQNWQDEAYVYGDAGELVGVDATHYIGGPGPYSVTTTWDTHDELGRPLTGWLDIGDQYLCNDQPLTREYHDDAGIVTETKRLGLDGDGQDCGQLEVARWRYDADRVVVGVDYWYNVIDTSRPPDSVWDYDVSERATFCVTR